MPKISAALRAVTSNTKNSSSFFCTDFLCYNVLSSFLQSIITANLIQPLFHLFQHISAPPNQTRTARDIKSTSQAVRSIVYSLSPLFMRHKLLNCTSYLTLLESLSDFSTFLAGLAVIE